jgi:ketose-bisphosphate aldolase
MLTTGRALLAEADAAGTAVGAFNTYNLEITRAILAAAEARGRPVMLAVGHGALRYGGLATLGALVLAAAREASVPVAVHLDHSPDLETVTRCLAAGFTSAMIDGSPLPFADNVALTRAAVQAAGEVAVEGELGGVAGDEDRSGPAVEKADGAPGAEPVPMTDPEQAARFVAETGVASLAVAIGNAHGLYRGTPRLDLARLAAIRARVPVPLVLHGASGLDDDDLWRCIERGVRKINVNTEIRQALFLALEGALARDAQGYDVPRLFGAAMAAMQRIVEEKIALFAGLA